MAPYGEPVLVIAAALNPNPEVLKVLLDAGSDANAEFNDLPVLFWAASQQTGAHVRVLLEGGADPEFRTSYGLTVLTHAAETNPDPEVYKALIEAGADVNAPTGTGTTAIMIAAGRFDSPEILRILVDAGADVNARVMGGTKYGVPALCSAISSNKLGEVRLLLEASADPNAYVLDGYTALTYALSLHNQDREIIGALIADGAKANIVDKEGQTPLMLAAMKSDDPEIVKILVDNGANVNEVYRSGQS